MFTVEFEKDYSVVTSMDEQNNFDDIEMYLENNGVVFLRQYVEEIDTHHLPQRQASNFPPNRKEKHNLPHQDNEGVPSNLGK